MTGMRDGKSLPWWQKTKWLERYCAVLCSLKENLMIHHPQCFGHAKCSANMAVMAVLSQRERADRSDDRRKISIQLWMMKAVLILCDNDALQRSNK